MNTHWPILWKTLLLIKVTKEESPCFQLKRQSCSIQKGVFYKRSACQSTSNAAWGQQSLFKTHKYLGVQQNRKKTFVFSVLPAKFYNAFGNLNNRARISAKLAPVVTWFINKFLQQMILCKVIICTCTSSAERKLQDTEWFSPLGQWSASEVDYSTLNRNGQTSSLTRGFGDVMWVSYSKCKFSTNKMVRGLLLWRNWCTDGRNCPRCSYALSTTYLLELK